MNLEITNIISETIYELDDFLDEYSLFIAKHIFESENTTNN